MSESPSLDRDTLLVRAPHVVVHLTDDDSVTLELGGESVSFPKMAVAILDAFAQPARLGDVLARLAFEGPEHFIEASSVALQLESAGALHAPGAQSRARARGYVKPSIHIAMLDDHVRTEKFCAAIRALVRPTDVVVDIGTGTGILAACAAIAGARKVFAFESTAIADVAEQVYAANGVSERVTLVRERSTHASLPERGDLLVTEMIGNDPLDEHLIEVIADARARLLRPNARIVPSRLEIVACPVEIPAQTFARHVFTKERVDAYERAYGVALGPLLAHRLGASKPVMIKTAEACTWHAVGPFTSLAEIDLEKASTPSFDSSVHFELKENVMRFGFFLAFRATLAEGIVLSTVPGEVDPSNHWRFALWPALDLGEMAKGARVDAHYHYERGSSTVRFERTS
ncbi:MAG: 50S ribosomal protein L11 methyltransferase [Deltaproteobacteria bacterium]|nr:50S ribosomal protein L11 methyltransferase [Deltaproteobacteria bacterium]